MKIQILALVLVLSTLSCKAQNKTALTHQNTSATEVMTPELLWELGRVTALGISKDQKNILYKVSYPSVASNDFSAKYYSLSIEGGVLTQIPAAAPFLNDKHLSPDGKHILYTQRVLLQPTKSRDMYPNFLKSDVMVYNALDYRHWDTWEDGHYSHLFFKKAGAPDSEGIDLLAGQKFHCPTKPWGGAEDYSWSPDSKKILYVSKKLSGTDYALSTNTDIYEYDLENQTTINLSLGMEGYDTEPAFSSTGALAWLSMKRNGYEADKNDIIVLENGVKMNLTQGWDGSVNHFLWAEDGKRLYFTAAVGGTVQLFEVDYPGKTKKMPLVVQLTNGPFDITGIVGQVGGKLFLTRTDMNTATEIYSFDIKTKALTKLTSVNDEAFSNIKKSEVKKRMVKTTDGKDMTVWVIYPPDFDPAKKYPTLLYCQGGPQSALSHFYSFRWNFQLMAAQGYIVVAPNRRGMPGHGNSWNEQISQDWGGQVMQDYLSAIDDVAKQSYVDNDRIGAVGASYGGYSVFYLAGIHQNRFKSFISHCGVFNLQSMYGTTEEVFFTNFDLGGAYWEKDNAVAQKAYNEFNPINYVKNWNTPILIIQGGKDYRVPIGQGQEAFQAAQLLGIKSRFVYFPEENHWVLSPQNGMVWQNEFFKWLKETL